MPLYIESNRLEKYRLVLGLSYPFECYEFETSEERDAALIDELDYLSRFMSRTAWRKMSGLNQSTQGEHLEKERTENGIDEHDSANVHLIEMARLAEFDSIRKFAVSVDQLVDVVQRLGHSHGLRMTKSRLYVIQENHAHEETSSTYSGYCDEKQANDSGFIYSFQTQ